MTDTLWVVEMRNWHSHKFEATVGCGLTREDARREKKEWEHNCPTDKFRIRRYRRIEK